MAILLDEENKNTPVVNDVSQQDDKYKVTTTTTKKKQNPSEIVTNNYKITPFTTEMEQTALSDAEKSSPFQMLMNRRNERLKDYKERSYNAARNAKMLAWGNLFTNLANLAGGGFAPVVKADTGFLDKAFAEADNLRQNYYKTDQAYSDALDNYKMAYIDNARKAHQASEKAKYDTAEKVAEAQNRLNLENTTTTETNTVVDPIKAAEQKRKDKELEIKRKQADSVVGKNNAQQKYYQAKADAESKDKSAKGKKDVLYEFDNPEDGYRYTIDLSKGSDIVNALSRIKDRAKSKALQEQIEKDMGLFEKAYLYGDKKDELRGIVSRYLQQYPAEFGDILSNVPRERIEKNDYESDHFIGPKIPASANKKVSNSIIEFE